MKLWRLAAGVLGSCSAIAAMADDAQIRQYSNRLTIIADPAPLLGDYPEFVQPIEEVTRYEGEALVDDPAADLEVRAWRFSYNARGVIEMPNRLRADQTAVIVVHPWGIDDGQGWKTPEPAGVADFCTPDKNHLAGRHTREVIDPLLKRLRPHVAHVMYSLRGGEYPVHKKIYRSLRYNPTDAERKAGKLEQQAILAAFDYRGRNLPETLSLSRDLPVVDYFKQFPGLQFGPDYDNVGFWDLPIPVTSDITMDRDDVVIYDDDGYEQLKKFLQANGVRHVLLLGYATDMCFKATTAGYDNLSKDFNVFLVGDATLATFPANSTPRFATNAHISFAALNQMVTQCSWIKLRSIEAAQSGD
jgi:hypothetical protein